MRFSTANALIEEEIEIFFAMIQKDAGYRDRLGK
jgi:hypothetical protein